MAKTNKAQAAAQVAVEAGTATAEQTAEAFTAEAEAEAEAEAGALVEVLADPEPEQVNTAPTAVLKGNKFNVAEQVWSNWSQRAQAVFNHLYWYMLQNQPLFKHPKAMTVPHEHWSTTCWNAAWIAANAADAE